jgi:hypothetical protein
VGDERRPPEVTVSDPSRPAGAADLLVSGDDGPPRPSPFTPRRLQAGAALVVVVALALGAQEWRERRAAAAEERRLDRVLELRAERTGGNASYDPATGSATLELQLDLRNLGPRQVVVAGARIGSYALVPSTVDVPPGDSAPLLLRRVLACSPEQPPVAEADDVLALDLRTAVGPRRLELALADLLARQEAERICGFLPIEEALGVTTESVLLVPEIPELRITLEVSALGRDALELMEVRVQEGLAARVGVLLPGPLSLPGRGEPEVVEVNVRVDDCAAAREAAPQVELFARDREGRVSRPAVGYDVALLSSLLEVSCPG